MATPAPVVPGGGDTNITVTAPAPGEGGGPRHFDDPWNNPNLRELTRPPGNYQPKPTTEEDIKPRGTSIEDIKDYWRSKFPDEPSANEAAWEDSKARDISGGTLRALVSEIGAAANIAIIAIKMALDYPERIVQALIGQKQAELEQHKESLFVNERVLEWLKDGRAWDELNRQVHTQFEQNQIFREQVQRFVDTMALQHWLDQQPKFPWLDRPTRDPWEVFKERLAESLIMPTIRPGEALTWWNPDQAKWEQRSFVFPQLLPDQQIAVSTQYIPAGDWRIYIDPTGVPRETPMQRIGDAVQNLPWQRWNELGDPWIEPIERAMDKAIERLGELNAPDPLPYTRISFRPMPRGRIEVSVEPEARPRMNPRTVPEPSLRPDPAERIQSKDHKTKSMLMYLAAHSFINKRFGWITEVGDFTQALLYGFTWADSGRRVRQWKDVWHALDGSGAEVDFSTRRFLTRWMQQEMEDRLIAGLKQTELEIMKQMYPDRSHRIWNAYGNPSTWWSRAQRLGNYL